MQINFKCIATSILSLTCAFALMGCGGSDKAGSAQNADVASGDVPDLNEKAGAAAIGFHNNLIEFTKLARSPLKKIMSTTKDSMSWIERDGVVGEKPMWNLVLSGINPFQKLDTMKISAPAVLPKADQEFFNTRIASVKTDAAALNKIVAELAAYYKANDHKDDKHQKIKDLEPKIKTLVGNIATACGEMGERSEALASAAERKSLQKIPEGIFILNMRDIMAKAGEQVDLIADERLIRVGSGTNFTDASKAADAAKVKDITDKLDVVAKEIKEMSDKMRNISTSKISKALAQNYADFFKALDDQQGTMRDKTRWIKEWGNAGTKSDIQLTISSYKNLVAAHNRFIESSNKER